MRNVKLLFYFSALVVAEATLNLCIPFQSSDSTGGGVDDVFKNVVSDVSEKYVVEENEPNLVIEHLDLNISHPAIGLQGYLDDVKLYNLLDFQICFLENIHLNDSGDYQFDVFNLTFHNLRLEGVYNVTGDLGDIFDLYGDGDFWVELHNLSIAMVNFTFILTEDALCFPVTLEIDLFEIRNHLDGLMKDDELEELFNNVLTDIAPESLKIIWQELKDTFDKPLEDAINDILSNLLHHRNFAPAFNILKNAQKGEHKSGKHCYPD